MCDLAIKAGVDVFHAGVFETCQTSDNIILIAKVVVMNAHLSKVREMTLEQDNMINDVFNVKTHKTQNFRRPELESPTLPSPSF